MIDNILTLMPEEIVHVLYILKHAIYPYPELISAGWSHVAASIFTIVLYLMYSISLYVFVCIERIVSDMGDKGERV